MGRPKMPKGRAPGEPPQKIEQLRACMASGDWRAALKLAASFPQLGDEKAASILPIQYARAVKAR